MKIENGKVVTQAGNYVSEIEADTVISAVGYRSDNSLYQELIDLPVPLYNVGDSNQVHNIMYAIWDAYEIARNI